MIETFVLPTDSSLYRSDALNYPICPEEAAEAATKSQKSALYSKAKRLLSQRVADGTVEGGLHSYQYSPKRKAYRDNSNEPGFDFEPCTESWVEGSTTKTKILHFLISLLYNISKTI